MTFPPGIPIPTEQRISVAAPAAGNDWSYTVPSNAWLRLVSGFATLMTSPTAANRYPGTVVTDSSSVEVGELENSPITASITQKIVYTISHNWQTGGSNRWTLFLALPYFVFSPGYTVGSITPNLQSGDRYSGIELLFERWTSQPFVDAWTPSLRVR